MRELDATLFAPRGWFAIDDANVRVSGVTPGSLDEALRLVGRGRVATVVGRLRTEVVAVDIDLAGDLGLIACEHLADWCTRRGLWHLVRPSGGGRGRAHVLIVPGVHAEALARHVDDLRADLHASRSKIDLRSQLRPLSAPHRRGGCPPVAGDVDELLVRLREVLAPLPRSIVDARPTPVVQLAGPRLPLTPRGRRRHDLPAAWATYLAEGRPAVAHLGIDRDRSQRSQIELEATFQLVIAGYSEPEAWDAITAAAPTAFPKARSRGRRWWWHTWNRCVIDADTWLASRRVANQRDDVEQGAGAPLHEAIAQQWLTWPARTRHVDLEVATAIADLMDRHKTSQLAVSQRDLLLASAIRSRNTIRASLARLAAVGVLDVEHTYIPGTTDSSDTITARPVSSTDPPRFQPPQRAPALPLRNLLGATATAVLRVLRDTGQGLPEVAQAAGLSELTSSEPTESQARTTRAHLRHLAELGLATVDDAGQWRHSGVTSADATAAGRRIVEQKHAEVGSEREEFRDTLDVERRRARWEAQRDAAIARSRKAARARQRQWWSQLTDAERQARRLLLEGAFAQRSVDEQSRLKDTWAARRAAAGENERTRWEAWHASLSPAELDERSIDRTLAFGARPGPERTALVAAWAAHRARWGLPAPRVLPGLPHESTAGASAGVGGPVQLELDLAHA